MEQAFQLRPWKLTDLNDLVKYANNEKISSKLTDMFPHPYGMKDGIKFIKMTIEQDPLQIFAIDINGRASGAIGLHPQTDIHRKNSELGYWLAEPFWGKGITTNAIKEIVKYGFENFDINRIFARPFSINRASQKVLEKAGFKMEAKLDKTLIKNGIYMDELIYAIRRDQYFAK